MKVREPHLAIALNVRQSHSLLMCDFRKVARMESPEDIKAALLRLRIPHEEIGAAIGRDRTVATKIFGKASRQIKAHEIAPLLELINKYERDAGEHAHIPATTVPTYVEVEVLPTYAGMGGGGSGEGDRATALLPRSLVEDQLRAKAADLLLIDVRGDSMEPTFQQGDQVLVDRRDRNPRQPGPFALWFDDGYVLKNVEIIRKTGKMRIFSNNAAYSDDEADPEEVTVMGRPVWFARSL